MSAASPLVTSSRQDGAPQAQQAAHATQQAPLALQGWPAPTRAGSQLGSETSIKSEVTDTAAVTSQQSLITLSQEFDFVNLELLKPTRMNQVCVCVCVCVRARLHGCIHAVHLTASMPHAQHASNAGFMVLTAGECTEPACVCMCGCAGVHDVRMPSRYGHPHVVVSRTDYWYLQSGAARQGLH